MKKIITIIISICIMLSFSMTVYGANSATVAAKDIVLTENEELIPVEIKNNSGIMGFKITVRYDTSKIDVRSVTKGEVCAKGNFNTNFGNSEDNFDVVWNNTDNVKEDGNLFILSAKSVDGAKGKTDIKITYSQPDTFDVLYKDVVLDCKDISITLAKQDETTTSVDSTVPNKEDTTNSWVADDEQMIQAIDTTLSQEGVSSIDEVKDKKLFIEELTENLNTITGSTDNNIVDFDSIKDIYNNSYSNEFIKEVANNIDKDKVKNIIRETLKDFNVDSIEDLNDADKQKFVASVEEKLKAEDSDIPNISNDLETEYALDIIEKLYKNKSIEESDVEIGKPNKVAISVCASVLGVLVIGVAFIVLKKRKTNS